MNISFEAYLAICICLSVLLVLLISGAIYMSVLIVKTKKYNATTFQSDVYKYSTNALSVVYEGNESFENRESIAAIDENRGENV